MLDLHEDGVGRKSHLDGECEDALWLLWNLEVPLDTRVVLVSVIST